MGLERSMALVVLMAGLGCHPTAEEPRPGPTAQPQADPGHVVLHRLNGSEYDLTVRDLLGSKLHPASAFPEDDRAAGFDNIASNLTLSQLHLEQYLAAAEDLAVEALGLEQAVVQRVQGEAPQVQATAGTLEADALRLLPGAQLFVSLPIEVEGRYRVAVRAWVDGTDEATVDLAIDGDVALSPTITARDPEYARVAAVDVQLIPGDVVLQVVWPDDGLPPSLGLHVDWLQLTGPLAAPSEHLLACDWGVRGSSACARDVLHELGSRAWRRPITEVERSRLTGLAERVLLAEPYEDALRYGIMAILTSPSFLFRTEPLADPTSLAPQPLDDWAMASRLSYFLWSSMPDAALFAAARAGELQTPEGVTSQVRRMLADPKADAVVDHFGGQWLYVRGIDALDHVDPVLRASMQQEMRRFFATFVATGRDLRELLTSSTGEIDAVLAAHYGVAAPAGWQEADLAPLDRGGVLGQAGLLSVVSHIDRTSPVRRGQFVMRQLLCDDPPPPPPGVQGLMFDGATVSQREQLEQHRADPSCAACHATMDELGFALEHFGPVGAWRDADAWGPVDATAILPDGTTFYGARELAAWVAQDPRYPACVSEQLLTYALGRRTVEADAPELARITDTFVAEGATFEALAVAIATSPPFRMSRGEEAP